MSLGNIYDMELDELTEHVERASARLIILKRCSEFEKLKKAALAQSMY